MTEPLVNELLRRYPSHWVGHKSGLSADLLITGLPVITFKRVGKDLLTGRMGTIVMSPNRSYDHVPKMVISFVWERYTAYVRRDKAPPELPSWLIEPMASWLEYVERQEINDAGRAYCMAMEHAAKINKHIQTMKGTV